MIKLLKKNKFSIPLNIILLLFFLLQIPAFAFLNSDSKLNYVQINYEKASELFKNNELEAAYNYFNGALRVNPNHIPSLISIAQVSIKLSKNEEAISYLKKAAILSPEDSVIHFLLGIAYKRNNELKLSIGSFNKCLQLEPQNSLIRLQLGLVCSETNNHSCVIDNLGKVVLAYPDQIWARASLANSYHNLKEYGLAESQYKYLVNVLPDKYIIWYNLAKSQLATSKFDEALISINNSIKLEPSSVDLYLDRAKIYVKLNMLQDAQADYLNAIKLDPQNPEIPVEYASFLSQTDAYSEAAKQYDAALELQPGEISFLVDKSYLLQKAGDLDQAENTWKKVISFDDNNIIAHYNLAKLYEEKQNYNSAIEHYEKAISLQDENEISDIDAKIGLAFCLQKTKNYEKAKPLYQYIISKSPEDPISHFNLAKLLVEEENYLDAVSELQKSITNNFKPLKLAYELLVEIYTSTNDSSNLDKAYKDLLEVDRDNIDARIAYATFLKNIGKTQEAINQFLVASTLDKTTKSKLTLAKFLIEQNDLFGAVNQLQEYIKVFPENIEALDLLAKAYGDLKIHEQSINTYKKAISLKPNDSLRYYNLGIQYQAINKFDESKNYLLKSIELNSSYAPSFYALGVSFVNENDIEKAKESFDQYLKIEPEGEYKDKIEIKLKEIENAKESVPENETKV